MLNRNETIKHMSKNVFKHILNCTPPMKHETSPLIDTSNTLESITEQYNTKLLPCIYPTDTYFMNNYYSTWFYNILNYLTELELIL